MELFLKPAQRKNLVPAPNFRSYQTSTYAGCGITCVRARVQSQKRSWRRACPTLWKRSEQGGSKGVTGAPTSFEQSHYAGSYAQAGMPNKRLAQSKLVRLVLNKGEARA